MKAERTGNGRIGWEGRLFRYISLLLIVAVLFSGVTFARYASMSEGSLTTGIARFDPSFTVDGVNSFKTRTIGRITTSSGWSRARAARARCASPFTTTAKSTPCPPSFTWRAPPNSGRTSLFR